MTIVRNRLTDVEGDGDPGWVICQLLGPGLRPATQTEIISQQAIRTDADGYWELELSSNTSEAPYYVVSEQATDYRTVQHLIHVPESETPVWLGDITVRLPLPVGFADAVYAGPPGPPGPPGPAGNGAVDTVNGKTGPNVVLTANDIGDGTTKGIVTLAERSKLAGVQAGATANSADEILLDRGNHVGEQPIDTVTGLQEALDGKVDAGDLESAVAGVIGWTPVHYRYDNALRYSGSGAMPRPATSRPVEWFVPSSFTLPNTGTVAGGTTASVPGLDVVNRYS